MGTSWPDELQEPHFHIVNPDASAAVSQSIYPNGCTTTDTENPVHAKPDFVFAFAIGQLKNQKGAPEKVSPHLLVYLPIVTGGRPARTTTTG